MADTTTTKTPTIAWFEIGTRDAKRATSFYGELFGWSFSAGPADTYAIASTGEGGVAGGINSDPGTLGPYAIFCVAHPDTKAACEQVVALGGTVLAGPETMDGLTYANVADPDGNHFGIFTPPAEPPAG